MGQHVVLLGDSIFDNASYTRGEPDVVNHLQSILPSDWRASLLAVDGAITRNLPSQLRRVPADASHLVVSIGGNDLLGQMDLLDTPVRSTAEALELFGEEAEEFEASYRAALKGVLEMGKPTTLCTVYNGSFPDPLQALTARIALTFFNDVIFRTAFENGLSLIDLRLVCDRPEDYANPIEPSGPGGRKIALAIARSVGAVGPIDRATRVLVG